MNREQASVSFKVTGIAISLCGMANLGMAAYLAYVVFLDEITSSSSLHAVVNGFWSGFPLTMSGLWLTHSSNRRQKRQAFTTCVVPCFIALITALLQVIKSGMEAPAYTVFNIACSAEKVGCAFEKGIYMCAIGLIVSSSIGMVACLIAVIALSIYLKSDLQDPPISPATNDPVVPTPLGAQVLSCNQITTPIQQLANYGPPVDSIQPNHPQIETTRDDVILVPRCPLSPQI